VNETLIMGRLSIIIAYRFKHILEYYLATSRGLINKIKSRIYSWNIVVGMLANVDHILDFSLEVN